MAIPSLNYPEDELLDPEAWAFGCDADYDAWKIAKNIVPDDAASKPFRTTGGHIHLGHEEIAKSDWHIIKAAKLCDAFHGVISIVLDHAEDSKARRSLYGKAGCHRPKPYGIEYRTLSSYWIGTPELASITYKVSEAVIGTFLNDKTEPVKKGKPVHPEITQELGAENIVKIINESEVEKARGIVDSKLRKILGNNLTNKILNLELTKASRDVSANWKLLN